MEEVKVGIVGLGNVGSGALAILAENGDEIASKLGFRLKVTAVCSRSVHAKILPAGLGDVFKTADWRQLVEHPEVEIVAELVGGVDVAAQIVDAAIAHRKSVVTANKELMAARGPEIWDRAIRAGINLAMEASVCGGIPIHAVLREGISGDGIVALYGILNGTCIWPRRRTKVSRRRLLRVRSASCRMSTSRVQRRGSRRHAAWRRQSSCRRARHRRDRSSHPSPRELVAWPFTDVRIVSGRRARSFSNTSCCWCCSTRACSLLRCSSASAPIPMGWSAMRRRRTCPA